jgi:hypothetical protein
MCYLYNTWFLIYLPTTFRPNQTKMDSFEIYNLDVEILMLGRSPSPNMVTLSRNETNCKHLTNMSTTNGSTFTVKFMLHVCTDPDIHLDRKTRSRSAHIRTHAHSHARTHIYTQSRSFVHTVMANTVILPTHFRGEIKEHQIIFN